MKQTPKNGKGRCHLRSVAITCDGWAMPFTVVEENPTGLGRRFVAWPKGKNAHGDCEAKASLTHVPYHLVAVFGEVSAVFDLKASFFHASLPQGSRASFRGHTEPGRLVEATRPPKGYERRPEMLHTVARVLVGDPAVVSSKYAPPRSLKIHVRIGNVGTSGPRHGLDKWGRVVTRMRGSAAPCWVRAIALPRSVNLSARLSATKLTPCA
ncbi:hypothetical protein ERJ75_000087200 [Trypanosoma vivax]|nr:hypothetical protein ERJ75_000087200 [Trypanosoma vivax]